MKNQASLRTHSISCHIRQTSMKASSEQQAMELNELIEAVISYTDSSEARSVLTTAFQIAVDAHKGYQRISGEPYVNHILAVASILAGWHAPLSIVTVGLLHDIRNPDYSMSTV